MDILITLAKYLVVSLLLWLLYTKLLREGVSYRIQRVVIISIPILSLAAALISFDIFTLTPPDNIERVANVIELQREYYHDNPFVIIKGEGTKSAIAFDSIIQWIWITISVLFALRYIYSLLTILNIKRLATKNYFPEFTLCRSGLVDTPFSFFRMIFINREIEGERKVIIMEHESAHISHHHYIDRSIIEFYTIISWFNPVVWWARREVEAIHEFQADEMVINSHHSIAQYKLLLAEEMGLSSPAIANGFNHSLLKERILRMTHSRNTKGAAIRIAITLAATSMLILLTSFTHLREEVQMSISEHTQYLRDILISHSDNTPVEKQLKVLLASNKVNQEGHIANRIVNMPEEQRISELERYIRFDKGNRLQFPSDTTEYNYYYLAKDQFKILPKGRYERVYIYPCDGYTEVDVVLSVPSSDSWWTTLTENSFLIDEQSGDRYKIHSNADGIPLNRTCVVRNNESTNIVLTHIFPPLKEGVKSLTFSTSRNDFSPKNGSKRPDETGLKPLKKRPYSFQDEGEVITLEK